MGRTIGRSMFLSRAERQGFGFLYDDMSNDQNVTATTTVCIRIGRTPISTTTHQLGFPAAPQIPKPTVSTLVKQAMVDQPSRQWVLVYLHLPSQKLG